MSYLLSFGNKPWESLARKLKDDGFESEYLDRLQRKVSTLDEQIDELEKEIMYETACALKRSEDKVNLALLQIQVAGIAIERADDDVSRRAAIAEFNSLLKVAHEARRELTIHREAAGMRIRNWDRTQRLYPIPPMCPDDARVAPKPPVPALISCTPFCRCPVHPAPRARLAHRSRARGQRHDVGVGSSLHNPSWADKMDDLCGQERR